MALSTLHTVSIYQWHYPHFIQLSFLGVALSTLHTCALTTHLPLPVHFILTQTHTHFVSGLQEHQHHRQDELSVILTRIMSLIIHLLTALGEFVLYFEGFLRCFHLTGMILIFWSCQKVPLTAATHVIRAIWEPLFTVSLQKLWEKLKLLKESLTAKYNFIYRECMWL